MTAKRFFFVMIGTVVLLGVLIIGSAVGGNVLFKKQSAKLADLKAQNQVVEDQKVALIQARKDIEKYSELDSVAKAVVPQDKDQAKTVRELTKIANDSGIKLKAITFTASSLGQRSATPAPTTGSGTATPAAPSITQVTPVPGIPGVFALEITISPVDQEPVPYYKFLEFLERLEGNRRTAHVNKITVSPTENGSGVSFVLTLNAYVKP